jgi:hypothetical protein
MEEATIMLLGVHPLRLLLVVLRDNATFPIPLAIVIQIDIARLETFHVALLRLRLRANEAAHRQCSGGGRIASLGIRATDELCLPAESDLARRLVARGFPKVKPARGGAGFINNRSTTEGGEVKWGPYKLPACRSETVRYMRVPAIDLCFDGQRSVRRTTLSSEAHAYVKMTSRRAEKCQRLKGIATGGNDNYWRGK